MNEKTEDWMNELITIEHGTPILHADIANKIASFESAMKELKAKEDELKKAILAEMEQKNIVKIDGEKVAITYIAPTDRETLDSKRLRADLPEIYDTYVKMSKVKSSIRIKLK